MDAFAFCFADQESNPVEDVMYLQIRFFEEKRTTVWITHDKETIRTYLQMTGQKTIGGIAIGEETEALEKEPNTQTVTIRSSGSVNVRAEPNKDAKKVGIAQAGGNYPLVSSAENGWLEIRLEDGETGYISPKMVK